MDMEKFVDDYVNFLRESLFVRDLNGSQEITLPFYDRNNDALTVYIQKINDDSYRISDDSYIINNLFDSGVAVTTKRMDTIKTIGKKLGVILDSNELYIISHKNDLVNKVHLLAQMMLRVDDMYLTSSNRSASYFIEDLIELFDKNDIFYSRDVSFVGKTGITHSFDFLFQRSKTNPERVCRAINNGTKSNMVNVLFAWQDIENIRNQNTNLIIILNDTNKIDKDVITGFDNYGVHTYRFNELDKNLSYFS